MTLMLKNVDSNTLRVIESLQGLNKKLQIEMQDECPICKNLDHTPSPKATKKLKKSLAEIEKKRAKGTLKSFSDIEELRSELEFKELREFMLDDLQKPENYAVFERLKDK